MDAPGFEVIGNHRFCICRPAKARDTKSASWHFPVVLFITVGALLTASKWAVVETEKGNFLPSKIVAIGLLAAFILSYVVAIASVVARKRRVVSLPEVQAPLPNQIACEARILHANKPFLTTKGWLGLDGDLLTFNGEEFDFALRPRDFHRSLDIERFGKGRSMRLLTIKGLMPTTVRLIPIGERNKGRSNGGANPEMEELLGRWRRAPISDARSLLPPLTHVSKSIDARTRKKLIVAFVGTTILFGLIGLLVHWMFRDYLPQGNPLLFALALALFPFTLVLAVLVGRLEANATRKLVERAKRVGRVDLV